jgi:hypothetical protein
MCVICIDWEKGKMTSKEAMAAIGEIIGNADLKKTEHLVRLAEKIVDKDVSPGAEKDSVLDEEWERKNRGTN